MNEPWELRWQKKEETLTLEGEEVLSYALSWPELSGGGGCARVGRFYHRWARQVESRWRQELYPRACLELAECRSRSRPFRPWSARAGGEVHLLTGEILSLSLSVEEWRGGGSRRLLRGDCWQLPRGWPLSLDEVIHRRELSGAILRSGEQLAGDGTVLLDKNWAKKLPRWVDRSSFWLEHGRIAVPIPQGAVAPGAEGCPVLYLPWEGEKVTEPEPEGYPPGCP